MTDRPTTTPAGVRLIALADIADGAARGFVLQLRAGRFHGFVVRRGETVCGYVDACPHMGLPLAKALDDYLTPDASRIACGWHGAVFAVEDGRCLGGPCVGTSLTPWPVAVVDGAVTTA